jgi:hypothetical protein
MRGNKQEAHYAAIGNVASNWAALEAIVTSAIWQIGEMDDAIGACITSQISTFDGKMKALVSILEVRGGFVKVIADVNAIHRHARPLATFRNRLVHDPLNFNPTTGNPQRLEITADKMPVLAYKDEPTSGVLSKAVEIADMIDRFGAVIKPALERYPPRPLPEKS